MELKVHKGKEYNMPDKAAVSLERYSSGEKENQSPLEMYELPNGLFICKREDLFFLKVEDEMLSISQEEALEVANNCDIAFEIVIEKKRKYWFNASSDNYDVAKAFFK